MSQRYRRMYSSYDPDSPAAVSSSSSSRTARNYDKACRVVHEKREQIDACRRRIAAQQEQLRRLEKSLAKDLEVAQAAQHELQQQQQQQQGGKENDHANTPRGGSGESHPGFSAGAAKRLEAAGLVQPDQHRHRKRLV